MIHSVVTGGAGCIGSDLAAELLSAGHQVTVLDNLSSGKREHIQALEGRRDFRFIHLDLLDFPALCEALAGCSMVWHLAANPDVKYTPGDATDKDLRQNTLATWHVLEAMRLNGIRRLAFASTSAVYGLNDGLPIPEEHACRPISLYGATKLGCEGLIHAFQNLFQMDCWIFRFANIVSGKTRRTGGTVIGDFIARLRDDPSNLLVLGNGRQSKSYLLSRECVAGMLAVVAAAPCGMHVLNLGCHDSITVDKIAAMVISEMGLQQVRILHTGGEGGWPGDVPQFQLDISAAGKLGWRARHTSEQAIRCAILATLARLEEEAACRQ